MTEQLQRTIDVIAERIEAKRFRSEAEVSLGIVQPVLSGLGWQLDEPGIVRPEFGVGNARRVDYALCAPPDTPVVLVEVKKLGAADVSAEHQLFSYCVLKGVPVAVLTDGQTWNFFLPAGPGSFEERRFCRIDLRADESTQCAEMLFRYLKYDTVKSGQNVKLAQKDLDTRRFRHTCNAVWDKLFREPTGDVLNLFMEALRDAAAIDPSPREVADWIRERAACSVSPPPPPPPPPGQYSVVFLDETTVHSKGIDVLVDVFTRLAERDDGFLRRYSEKYVGRKRKRVAKTRHEIHPENPDRRRLCRDLPGGWWIDSHLSNSVKEQWIRQACDEAGIVFEHDLRVHFPGQSKVPPKPRPPAGDLRPQAADSGHWVEFRGQRHAVRNGIEILVRAFTLLADEDPSFYERFRERYGGVTRGEGKRRETLRRRYRRVPGGWWVGINFTNRDKATRIEQACAVAGVRFGRDLRIHFPGKSETGS